MEDFESQPYQSVAKQTETPNNQIKIIKGNQQKEEGMSSVNKSAGNAIAGNIYKELCNEARI